MRRPEGKIEGIAIEMDVSCRESVDRAAADVVGALGRIEILIDAATVFLAGYGAECIVAQAHSVEGGQWMD